MLLHWLHFNDMDWWGFLGNCIQISFLLPKSWHWPIHIEGWQKKSSTSWRFTTFRWRQSCYCLWIQEKQRSHIHPQLLLGTRGWQEDRKALFPAQLWFSDHWQVPWKQCAWACPPISSLQLCSILSSLLGKSWWLCFLSSIKSSTETVTSMVQVSKSQCSSGFTNTWLIEKENGIKNFPYVENI